MDPMRIVFLKHF